MTRDELDGGPDREELTPSLELARDEISKGTASDLVPEEFLGRQPIDRVTHGA